MERRKFHLQAPLSRCVSHRSRLGSGGNAVHLRRPGHHHEPAVDAPPLDAVAPEADVLATFHQMVLQNGGGDGVIRHGDHNFPSHSSTTVEVFEEFAAGLKDLAGFERIWLLYWFDRAAFEEAALTVMPYLGDTPRGVFATRALARPNPIGLSSVRLAEVRGNSLSIRDVDILDGTPLLDIKPYVPRFDRFDVARSGWFDGAIGTRSVADNRFERQNR